MNVLIRIIALLALSATLWTVTYEISEAARRGGFGGGRSMSRGGPAMGGSFNRPSRSMNRSMNQGMNRDMNRGMNRSQNRDLGNRSGLDNRSGDRQLSDEGRQQLSERRDANQDRIDERRDNLSERQDDRQDYLSDRQDNRQEFYNDNREYYNDRQEWYEDAWKRGAYLSATRWRSVGCANVVYVNGIRYYDCGGVRYEQVYRSGQVTYVIVN